MLVLLARVYIALLRTTNWPILHRLCGGEMQSRPVGFNVRLTGRPVNIRPARSFIGPYLELRREFIWWNRTNECGFAIPFNDPVNWMCVSEILINVSRITYFVLITVLAIGIITIMLIRQPLIYRTEERVLLRGPSVSLSDQTILSVR